ncbi:MAG TPA: adenylate/guanylate cyclase domain-containing protein, partial [Candidatus Omnitrophota bacterium]|nr:adenylate/guanylate cyclase domain-containing protein [Candidatus Omnitrophota bacterium]
GQILFVGSSAKGLLDLRATPLDPVVPGVELHAQVVEQLVLDQTLLRPDWTLGAELLYILVLGVLLLVLIEWIGALWAALVGSLFLASALGLSWTAYAQARWLLDPIFPMVSLLMVYLTASTLKFMHGEHERRFVRGAFSRYLSPALVEKLADSRAGLTLGGEMRNMTLLFCDVRGFTTISEQFDPQGLTHLINSFLTPMTGIILKTGGTIDKYIGDCIMAFWNAPLDDPEHARHGCLGALKMMDYLPVLNEQLRQEAEVAGRKHIPLAIGIGLNSGDCCVGNMGSDQRFDYSVLGDTVNLASRLEGQSKPYGVYIVISEETHRQAPELAALELDLIRVKGKTQPVRIMTLLGDADMAQSAHFAAWKQAHDRLIACYRAQDWDGATQALEEARVHADGRIPNFYKLYEERIAAYRAAPPPTDWDGVFTATSK